MVSLVFIFVFVITEFSITFESVIIVLSDFSFVVTLVSEKLSLISPLVIIDFVSEKLSFLFSSESEINSELCFTVLFSISCLIESDNISEDLSKFVENSVAT